MRPRRLAVFSNVRRRLPVPILELARSVSSRESEFNGEPAILLQQPGISRIVRICGRICSSIANASYSGAIRVAGEEVDDALHRPAGRRLAGMHPGGDNDTPLPARLLVVCGCGDRQVVHAVSGQTAAQQAQLGEPRLRRVGHDPAEVLLTYLRR